MRAVWCGWGCMDGALEGPVACAARCVAVLVALSDERAAPPIPTSPSWLPLHELSLFVATMWMRRCVGAWVRACPAAGVEGRSLGPLIFVLLHCVARYRGPYLYMYLLRSETVEDYKARSKADLMAWVRVQAKLRLALQRSQGCQCD